MMFLCSRVFAVSVSTSLAGRDGQLVGVVSDERGLAGGCRGKVSLELAEGSHSVGLGYLEHLLLGSLHVLGLTLPDHRSRRLQRSGEAERESPRTVRQPVHGVQVGRCFLFRLTAGQEDDAGNGWRHSTLQHLSAAKQSTAAE